MMDPQHPPQHPGQHMPQQQPHYAMAQQSQYPGYMSQQRPQSAPGQHYSGNKDGVSYKLVVEQQPIRARMCGFGDKDRRPITPPPCVRLVVIDMQSHRELEIDKVDSTFCILQVDLWNEDATHAVNLVRHTAQTTPQVSISSTTMTSFPPQPERAIFLPRAPLTSQWAPQVPYGSQPPSAYNYPQSHAGPSYQPSFQSAPMVSVGAAATANQNFTRNLIGMNAVNACRLNDPHGRPGFWFVLQDLSVRTEGTFRLKFTMCDIGMGQGTNDVSQGKCPVLATAFSDPFTVYSAKKFPGVVESTPLSKCLAAQGIKIPIRKDGVKERGNQEEYDADE